jgi:hypothetical protein
MESRTDRQRPNALLALLPIFFALAFPADSQMATFATQGLGFASSALLHDAVFIQSNGTMADEGCTGKDMEGSDRGIIEALLQHFCLEGLRKIETNFSQDRRCPGRDSNPESSEYKSGTLPLRVTFLAVE